MVLVFTRGPGAELAWAVWGGGPDSLFPPREGSQGVR